MDIAGDIFWTQLFDIQIKEDKSGGKINKTKQKLINEVRASTRI